MRLLPAPSWLLCDVICDSCWAAVAGVKGRVRWPASRFKWNRFTKKPRAKGELLLIEPMGLSSKLTL
jgi:hypothetical protein